jgi:hypothetical protein
MKFGLSKTAVAISSPSPGHLKTQREKLEKLKENMGYGLSGRINDSQTSLRPQPARLKANLMGSADCEPTSALCRAAPGTSPDGLSSSPPELGPFF